MVPSLFLSRIPFSPRASTTEAASSLASGPSLSLNPHMPSKPVPHHLSSVTCLWTTASFWMLTLSRQTLPRYHLNGADYRSLLTLQPHTQGFCVTLAVLELTLNRPTSVGIKGMHQSLNHSWLNSSWATYYSSKDSLCFSILAKFLTLSWAEQILNWSITSMVVYASNPRKGSHSYIVESCLKTKGMVMHVFSPSTQEAADIS